MFSPCTEETPCKYNREWLSRHATISVVNFIATRSAVQQILISNMLNTLEKNVILMISIYSPGFALGDKRLKTTRVSSLFCC